MRVKGDGIFSINTSATGGFGSAGISLPEAVVEAGGGTIPITDNMEGRYSAFSADGVYSDGGVTTITNEGLVQQIDDLSPNGNNATQTTAADKIQWVENYNSSGYPAFFTSNTVQPKAVMDLGSIISVTNSQDFTIYVVCEQGSMTSFMPVGGGNVGAGAAGIGVGFGGKMMFMGDSYAQVVDTSDITVMTGRNVRTFVQDRTNVFSAVYEDGVKRFDVNAVQNQTMSFGKLFNRHYDDAFAGSAGDAFMEIIIYRGAHTVEQIEEMESFLKTRWGI